VSDPGTTYEAALLLTLEEISQLVAHSHDVRETLDNIVRLIQDRFHTAVCSVYLLEQGTGDLVLAATVGLDPRAVGRVRMHLDEGLTGLTAQRMAPVMVADAFHHPRFKYFPEAGEDPYRSFLGVPLVEGGRLQGVLVVQTKDARTFAPSEVRMLVTVAGQLAALVGDARLLEQIAVVAHEEPAPSCAPATTFTGIAISPGLGLGRAYVVGSIDEWREVIPPRGADPAVERKRLAEAMARARDELVRLSQHISELVGENHGAILQAQLMIMQDRTVEHDLEVHLAAGASAEAALIAVLDKYVAAFQKITTPFFQERIHDIKDVFHRILWQLCARPTGVDDSGRVVLVAREASVMELFSVDLERLAGVVVEHGGPQSHAAILARSLEIPMVSQVAEFTTLAHPRLQLLVDGDKGTVTVGPPADSLPAAPARARATAASVTLRPGVPRVDVNINLIYEVRAAIKQGITGVGLYRSEFLFLARRSLPTEEEQVGIYRKLLQLLAGRPVTIRTFDLRPDKLAAYSNLGAAARPYDWRVVLDSPPLQQLFRDQVRAILRAATLGNVRILVPLVTTSEVFEFVLETVAQAKESLRADGLEFVADVPVGVMIETAASVPLVAHWAERAAFFALGTNDLTASALGLDRDDPLAARLADPLHPGLLHFIEEVITAAHAANRPVSVCGESAGDPMAGMALAALRVDALSVPVNQFAAIRQTMSSLTPTRLAELRTELLRQRTSGAVHALLERFSPHRKRT
jgi:phosphotransferase system enzyme I (PtsP)